MTKAEVISQIVEKTQVSKEHTQEVVEAFFKVVKQALTEGNNIYVRGFGSFVVKKRARKVARNIAKNTPLVIDAHYIPAFKPSKIFTDRVKRNTKSIEKVVSDKPKTVTKKGK